MAVHRVQHHRDLPAARGGAPARQAAAPRVDRRGLRRPRARRPEPLHRETPLNPSSPYSASKASRRPARAGLDPVVRDHRDAVELLEQLRARTSTSRSSSRARSRTSCRASSPSSTAQGANVRDWIHVDDHNDAVITIVEQGRLGETYLIGADGEQNNRQIVGAAARDHGQAGRLVRPRARPPRARPALRDRLVASCGPRPAGGRATATSAPGSSRPSSGTATTRPGGPAPASSPRRSTSAWAADRSPPTLAPQEPGSSSGMRGMTATASS